MASTSGSARASGSGCSRRGTRPARDSTPDRERSAAFTADGIQSAHNWVRQAVRLFDSAGRSARTAQTAIWSSSTVLRPAENLLCASAITLSSAANCILPAASYLCSLSNRRSSPVVGLFFALREASKCVWIGSSYLKYHNTQISRTLLSTAHSLSQAAASLEEAVRAAYEYEPRARPRSPRARSRTPPGCPRARSRSLRARSRSLRARSRYLRARSRSLRARSRSLRVPSRSPRARSRSLRARSRSLRDRSRSLRARSRSPHSRHRQSQKKREVHRADIPRERHRYRVRGLQIESSSDEMKFSHILVKHTESKRPLDQYNKRIRRTKDEAMDIACDIHTRITRDLITFADAAVSYSECLSAEREGDIQSQFKSEKMLIAFKTTAIDLRPGKMSNVVETESGYHILQRREE